MLIFVINILERYVYPLYTFPGSANHDWQSLEKWWHRNTDHTGGPKSSDDGNDGDDDGDNDGEVTMKN